jgi:hypothetical protein
VQTKYLNSSSITALSVLFFIGDFREVYIVVNSYGLQKTNEALR